MSFRELTMVDVRELLRRFQAREAARRAARECGADRKTVKRYYEAARQCGVSAGVELTDELVGEVGQRVQARPAPPPSDAWQTLVPVRDRIETWLAADRPLRLVRIRELLAREGIAVSYSTLRRYAQREFGFGGPRVTVRLADTPPGEEAQVDFGHVGWLTDVTGQRRKLWALIVTLSYSRPMFVWPTLTQTVADVCEGLDEAWRFFGGIARRVVIDNASSMVTAPNAQAPELQRAFREYTQARGILADPARVRQPQDKGRVENAVPYVRERWAGGGLVPGRRRATRSRHHPRGATHRVRGRGEGPPPAAAAGALRRPDVGRRQGASRPPPAGGAGPLLRADRLHRPAARLPARLEDRALLQRSRGGEGSRPRRAGQALHRSGRLPAYADRLRPAQRRCPRGRRSDAGTVHRRLRPEAAWGTAAVVEDAPGPGAGAAVRPLRGRASGGRLPAGHRLRGVRRPAHRAAAQAGAG